MVKVKPESEIKKNYEDSTALVPGRYESGVKRAEWQAEALAGQDLYEEQMVKPEILARRASGISKVSNEAWRNDTIDKGRNVIGARMKKASGKQIEGYRPYREGLVALDLPAKTSDPMTNLMQRGGAVVELMVRIKKEQSS